MMPNGGGKQDRRVRRAGNPRHRHRSQGSRLRGHRARRQGLPLRIRPIQRQDRSLLRSQAEVHLVDACDPAAICTSRPATRARSIGSRRMAKARSFSRAMRPMPARWRSIQGQSDRRHRAGRTGSAHRSKGEGFVLYQMPKREVTAVAVGPDGSIYAAGVGTKQSSPQPAASQPHNSSPCRPRNSAPPEPW